MASRLVERLDAAIAQALDPFTRECLKAERVAVLARHGLLKEARFALTGLRTQSQRYRKPLLHAWVHLIDGLIDHFESVAPRALQKFAKAHDEAVLARHPAMQALASAWMAAVCFNTPDLEAALRHAVDALTIAPADAHAARARAGLVLADACRFAGDDQRSQRWYLRARQHASAEGDGSMISVLLYNIATMRSARIGLNDAMGRAHPDEARQALIEIDSVANYDSGVGTHSLATLVPVMRAQVFVVLARFEEAIALFDTHLMSARNEGMAHREARFLADRAWCHLRLRHHHEALRDARAAQQALGAHLDADDRAAVHGRLAAVYRLAERDADASAQQALAEAALAEHESQQRAMLAALDRALAGLD